MLKGGDRRISYLFHSALHTRSLLSCINQNGLTFGFQRNQLLIKNDWQLIRHKFLPRRLSQLLVWVQHTWSLLLPIFHPNPAAGTLWLTSRPIHSCSSSLPFPISTLPQNCTSAGIFHYLHLNVCTMDSGDFSPSIFTLDCYEQHSSKSQFTRRVLRTAKQTSITSWPWANTLEYIHVPKKSQKLRISFRKDIPLQLREDQISLVDEVTRWFT